MGNKNQAVMFERYILILIFHNHPNAKLLFSELLITAHKKIKASRQMSRIDSFFMLHRLNLHLRYESKRIDKYPNDPKLELRLFFHDDFLQQ